MSFKFAKKRGVAPEAPPSATPPPRETKLEGEGFFVPEYMLDEADELSVWQLLFKAIQKEGGRRNIVPLQCVELIDMTIKPLKLTLEVWAQLPFGTEHLGWEVWMAAYSVGQISTVAGRLLTSAVYSAEGTLAADAINGHGSYVLGAWVPNGEHHKYVVPVSPALAATALMASAGVKLTTKSTYEADPLKPSNKQLVTRPKYEYTHNDKGHPIALKKLLADFLTLPPEVDFDAKKHKLVPFIWEALAHKISQAAVISVNMKPETYFYYFINRPVDFSPVELTPLEFVTEVEPLLMKNYWNMIRHSWYVGGVHVPGAYFMAAAQAKYFPGHAWGGSFSAKLPNWCRVQGGKFEKEAGSVGSKAAGLEVKAALEPSDFTGVVWNPSKDGQLYTNCVGMAIPVNESINGMERIYQCFGNEELKYCVVMGPVPFLLAIQRDACEVDLPIMAPAAGAKAYIAAANIGVYNFVCNAMVNTAPDAREAIKQVFAYSVTGEKGDHYTFYDLGWDLVPGRFNATDVSTKETDPVKIFEAYAARGAGRSKSKAAPRPAGGAPPGKVPAYGSGATPTPKGDGMDTSS